jgi:hypothetical protein
MEDFDNKKGLVKRQLACEQLGKLADEFWELADTENPGKTEKLVGCPPEYVAGFAMGLNFAASVVSCYHLATPVLKDYAICYMKEQLKAEQAERLDDIFGWDSVKKLARIMDMLAGEEAC